MGTEAELDEDGAIVEEALDEDGATLVAAELDKEVLNGFVGTALDEDGAVVEVELDEALAFANDLLRFSSCFSKLSSSADNLVAVLTFFGLVVLAAFDCADVAAAFAKLNFFCKDIICFSNSSTLAPPRIFLPLLAFTVLLAIESSTSFQEFKW